MYDSPSVLGTPIYPEDLEVPRIPGRKPKGEMDSNFDDLLRVVASGRERKIHLQSVWRHGLPPIRTVIEPHGPLRLAVPIDLKTGREIEMTEKERQALFLPAHPVGFTVSRNNRVEFVRILHTYGWGGRLARRIRYNRTNFGPCPRCKERRAAWDFNCLHCGAKWESKNTTIGDSDVIPQIVRRLLHNVGVDGVKLLNHRKILVRVEHVHTALGMTAPGERVVLPEMAAMIDEAIEFERKQFRVLWCDYGKHVYFKSPNRGKACGFHARVARQRRFDFDSVQTLAW